MRFLLLILLLSISSLSFSQDEEEEDSSAVERKTGSTIFQSGVYVGVLFPNQSTASLYDGYGYDYDVNKNSFLNSFLYQKIIFEYGGRNGQADLIAQALNVNSGEWAFDQTDMPINMRYKPAITVGLQAKWRLAKQTAVLLNVNASKLSVYGNFSIQILVSPTGPVQPGYQNIKIFSVTGTEQRISIFTGLQRVFGEEEMFGFVLEGGITFNMVKFSANEAIVNNLRMDLMTQYNQYGYESYRAKLLTGVSFGAFAGLGINLNTNSKWTMQLLYTPMYGKVNLGKDQKLSLQNNLGLRMYYHF